jgi:hypothetical protein
MTLQIIPPGLTTDESSKPAASDKKFDRQEFFPSSLTDGQSEQFRLLGAYGTGHAAVYWRYPVEQMKDGELRFAGFRYTEQYPGAQPEGIARAIDWSNPARPKLDDEFVKVKKALTWIAYSLERKRPELLILEQRGLREGITEALQDGDYSFNDDAVAEFVLKISRRGTGLDTSYSVLPKPSKVTKAEAEAMNQVREMTVASLLSGGHPFIQPAAEFSSATQESEGEF